MGNRQHSAMRMRLRNGELCYGNGVLQWRVRLWEGGITVKIQAVETELESVCERD